MPLNFKFGIKPLRQPAKSAACISPESSATESHIKLGAEFFLKLFEQFGSLGMARSLAEVDEEFWPKALSDEAPGAASGEALGDAPDATPDATPGAMLDEAAEREAEGELKG